MSKAMAREGQGPKLLQMEGNGPNLGHVEMGLNFGSCGSRGGKFKHNNTVSSCFRN